MVSSLTTYRDFILAEKGEASEILQRFLAPDGQLFFVVASPDTCETDPEKPARKPCFESKLERGVKKCVFHMRTPRLQPILATHELCEYDDLLAVSICDELVGRYQALGSSMRPELITRDKDLRIFWKGLGRLRISARSGYSFRPGRVSFDGYKDALGVFRDVAREGGFRFGAAEYTLAEFMSGDTNKLFTEGSWRTNDELWAWRAAQARGYSDPDKRYLLPRPASPTPY